MDKQSSFNVKQALPGIWKITAGEPDAFTPLTVAPVVPREEAIRALGETPLPFGPGGWSVEIDACQTIVSHPLDETERIYGFGLQFMRLDQRGFTRYLRVNSDPKQDTGETHAPIPFYVSSAGYGVLIDTARAATAYCGSTVKRDAARPPVVRDRVTDPEWQATPLSDAMELVIPKSAGVTLYLFAGRTTLEIVQRFNLFMGGGALPPKWGLGFWHRVSIAATQEEVIAEAKEFRERGYPCDVLGLEPGWQSSAYPNTLDWSEERFPNPGQLVEELGEMGFRVNLWENPYVSPKAPLHGKLEKFAGSHTVWGGLVPDLAIKEAADILREHHLEKHIRLGVSGYKMDEVDGSELTGHSWMFPAHARFPSGLDGERMRQIYGLLWQRLLADAFRGENRRTYGLVRASNAGSSSNPFVLYSDLYDHRQFVRALCNASFGGLLWTPELRETGSMEEFVRRLQVVCFSPLAMCNAWASGMKMWTYPEAEPIVRHYLGLRARLLPYLYSAFAAYRSEGIPPFRAMALEAFGGAGEHEGARTGAGSRGSALEAFDSKEAAYGFGHSEGVDDQYMMGPSMLVAPMFEGETERDVWLPEGDWYDFETGERHEGGRRIHVVAGLERMPIFVKDGGIVPMLAEVPVLAGTLAGTLSGTLGGALGEISGGNLDATSSAKSSAASIGEGPLNAEPEGGELPRLEIRHYGRKPGSFALYDDDGETFAYERGDYGTLLLRVDVDADGNRRGEIVAGEGGRKPAYGEAAWRFFGA